MLVDELNLSSWLIFPGVLAALGLILMALGARVPRRGDWLAGAGVFSTMVYAVVRWNIQGAWVFSPHSMVAGWIWPREEGVGIGVGLVEDPIALGMILLVGLIVGLRVFRASLDKTLHRPERAYSALVFSYAGVTLAVLSATPWLALVGLGVIVAGSFAALASETDHENEDRLSVRFFRERAWALSLTALGGFIVGSQGVRLSWVVGEAWPTESSSIIGAALMALGLLIYMQPFPLLGAIRLDSERSFVQRLLSLLLLPGMTALIILTRLAPHLTEVGVLKPLSCIALGSAILAAAAGLLAKDWKQSILLIGSSSLCGAVAALGYAGSSAAFAIAVGAVLGVLALAECGANLEREGGSSEIAAKRARITRGMVFVSAAVALSFVGFVGVGGRMSWLLSIQETPLVLIPVVLYLLISSLLVSKTAWNLSTLHSHIAGTWLEILLPSILIVGSLGILWTGTLTGGALSGATDELFFSWIDKAFLKTQTSFDGPAFTLSSALYWLSWAIGVGVSYFLSGRGPDWWMGLRDRSPRTSQFVEQGYGMDVLCARTAEWVENQLRAVDARWQQTKLRSLPTRGFEKTVAALGDAGDTVGLGVDRLSAGAGRITADVPGKALQIIQSGNVQWYIFFSLGTGIAVLIHFLRSR